MNFLTPLTSLIGGAVGGIVDIFKTKQERKKLKEVAQNKLKQSIVNNQHEITLTDAEGEAMLAEGLGDSWKDEYVTIIITAPIIFIILGVLYFMFTGDSRLLDSGTQAVTALDAAGVDMGFLMNAVVLSAVGLKVWRKS